jgi:hypothetical protein
LKRLADRERTGFLKLLTLPRKDTRYMVAYPPDDVEREGTSEIRPWEWLMEPSSYRWYWMAALRKAAVNSIAGKNVAVVVSQQRPQE